MTPANSRVHPIDAASARRGVRDYALAHLGKSFFWVAGDALTIYILIRYAGYGPVAAGSLFLAALLWNAICDVAVGCWADRRGAAGRTLAPVLAVAAPTMGAAFVASLFLPPRQWPWELFAALVFRTAFAVFDVPHNAMMARLSTTPAIGLDIANLRTIASGVAALVVGVVAMPLIDRGGEAIALPLVLILSAVSIVLLLPFLRIFPRLERLPLSTESRPDFAPAPAPALSFARLCAVATCSTVALAALGKAILHLNLVHNRWATGTVLVMMLGRIAATLAAGPAIAQFGSAGALRVACLIATGLILALPFAVAAGEWLPLLVILLLGFALGVEVIVSWLILAAIVRSSRIEMRRGSLRFGLFTMIAKVAAGSGGWLLGWLLARADVPGSTQIVMDAGMLWGLCLAAAFGTLLAAWLARPSPSF
ncbi:MAG: MFS transporter [Rudaea sp.]|uniref:MFS transporter n=1 Tax=Rudaea sp. TaxID=2136325 RepID=UPI0039E2CDBC